MPWQDTYKITYRQLQPDQDMPILEKCCEIKLIFQTDKLLRLHTNATNTPHSTGSSSNVTFRSLSQHLCDLVFTELKNLSNIMKTIKQYYLHGWKSHKEKEE